MERFDFEDFVVAIFGLTLLILIAWSLLNFIASIVFGIFIYYATRPIYRRLEFLSTHRMLRGGLTILLFALPFIVFFIYTFALIFNEGVHLVHEYNISVSNVSANANVAGYPTAVQDISTRSIEKTGENHGIFALVKLVADHAAELLSVVTDFLPRFIVMVAVTYYMLTDSYRLKEWFLVKYDDTGVYREYLENTDEELSTVLFANILSAGIIAVIAITVYIIYNIFAPPIVEVPFPALVGALTGLTSLIPVIGMKIVWIPVGLGLGLDAVLHGQHGKLTYILVFFLVNAVVVDFIPDFILRPYISGRNVHIGLLMFAYVLGPLTFGLYGLILGPIILVMFITFVDVLLPHLVSKDTEPPPDNG